MSRKQNTAVLLRQLIREEIKQYQTTFVNEASDSADPIVVHYKRAEILRRRGIFTVPALEPAEAKKLTSLLTAISRELNRYYARRNQLLNDMEQAGEVGDYGAKLDKIEEGIVRLINQRKSIELKLI